jgi:hypothetical protein
MKRRYHLVRHEFAKFILEPFWAESFIVNKRAVRALDVFPKYLLKDISR